MVILTVFPQIEIGSQIQAGSLIEVGVTANSIRLMVLVTGSWILGALCHSWRITVRTGTWYRRHWKGPNKTNNVITLKKLPYKKILEHLHLVTLKFRRLRGDNDRGLQNRY